MSWYAPQRAAELEIELTAPTPLVDIASRLGLPAAEIAFAADRSMGLAWTSPIWGACALLAVMRRALRAVIVGALAAAAGVGM